MGRPGGPPYCGVRYNTSVNMRTPAGALFATVVLGAAPAFAASCESLTSLSLPETTITLAQPVAAGTFTVPGAAGGKGKQGPSYRDLPAFCRVTATVKPTSDSDIRIEVWMPDASGWNGKFQGNGNGGWTGSINPATLAAPLRRELCHGHDGHRP